MRAEHWWYTLPLRIRSLVRREQVERELADELGFHVDELTAQHVARGMTPDAARTAALRAIGGLERRKEEVRETRGISWAEDLWRDLRYAWRMLRKAPAFTAIVVLTLAVGAGANAAIFTIVDSVLLQPLRYGHPERLVVLDHRSLGNAVPAELIRWRAEARSFESIGGAVFHTSTVTGRGDAEQLNQLFVTTNIFPMMQVAPLLGRVFTADEGHAGTDREVVLSYAYWHTHFGDDVHALGQTLVLDGVPRTVIGVMPRGFQFAPYWATRNDVWVPLSLDGDENNWDAAAYRVFARLRPGVTLAVAQAEMTRIGTATKQDHPKAEATLVVTPLRERVVSSVQAELWILFAAVALVLLIACANVSHLELMRATAREREASVRLALGAGSGRLIQQSLIESLLLAAMGAAVGLVLAVIGVRALVTLAPPAIPRLDGVHVNGVVFAFLAAIAGLTGLLSGLMPALSAARIDPAHVLKQSGRGGDSARRRRIGRALVISEFAMAVMLLIGASLVLRSFAAMLHVDPGFDPAQVTTMQVAVRGTAHGERTRRDEFYEQLLARIRATPGVDAASAVNHLPLHGDTWRLGVWTEEHPLATQDEQPHAYFRVVRPGYFGTLRLPLVRGRDVTAADGRARAHVVVVDEGLAQLAWPGGDALGKQLSIDDPATGADWFTVVGVVRNMQQANWSTRHEPEMFFPYWRSDGTELQPGFVPLLNPAAMTVVVRSRLPALAVTAAVRQAVASLDRDAPIADVVSMDRAVDEQVAEPRFYLVLLGAFAAIALLLASIGVYGVMSHAVSSRARETAIRLALGASRGVPLRMALQQGIRLAGVGTVTGVLLSLGLTRFLGSLLYQVAPTDPVSFALVPLVLLIIAAVACYLPARRAAAVDPATALRAE